MFRVCLQRSLYWLKPLRMWFNQLSNFLLKRCYTKNDDCPYDFINKSNDGLHIISIYLNDLNVIETRNIEEAMTYLNMEFEIKDLGKTNLCLYTRADATLLNHHGGPIARSG